MMQSYSRKYVEILKNANSLADVGSHYAKEKGSSVAYTFLSDGKTETHQIDFTTLEQKARAIASTLAENFKPGSRALLLYPPGLEFIEAFLGCLYAKIVAVPAYIPQRRKEHWLRLAGIAQSADISAILTIESLCSVWNQSPDTAAFLGQYQIIATDVVTDIDASSWLPQSVENSELAFLQFTSGSTGAPKGVMITHQALLSNQLMIANAFEHNDGVVMASWLPIYHDMGLIGSILQPFCLGGHAVFMPPVAFLQSPVRWLSMISKYKATTSGAPNFAYELCVNRITEEQSTDIDLSHWKVAFNGAEPVQAETMNKFAKKFAPYKFDKKSFFPCYGLAESTLFVSGGPTQRSVVERSVSMSSLEKNIVEYASTSNDESKTLVSSGSVCDDVKILIMEPDNLTICSALSVGEIWLSSPSVAKGYYGNEVATRETFKNLVTTESSECYLRTGDLGFYDGGELFVTGRVKDMIIIRGRNLYPHDIESAVQRAHPAFREGCGAAFSVDINHEERLVLVQEVERTHIKKLDKNTAIRAITQAVSENFGTQVHDIVLIRHGTLVKTSSGKIERRTCKRQYLAGELTHLFIKTHTDMSSNLDSKNEVKNLIRNIVAKVLRVNPDGIDSSTSLLAHGLDSLGAVELHHALELQFSKQISIENLLAGYSIDAISSRLNFQSPQNLTISNTPKILTVNSFDTGFSPNQKALWSLYQLDQTSAAYNVAFAMRFDEILDINRLEKSLAIVLERHEALRTTFSTVNENFTQSFKKRQSPIINLRQCDFMHETGFYEEIVLVAKEPFDLANGPVFRANLFTRAENFSVLLLSAHHIVIDLWSLSQIVKEISLLYSGKSLVNHPIPRSYSDFVRFSEKSINSHDFETSLVYWKKQLVSPLPILNLPLDFARPRHQTFKGANIDITIEATQVNKLKRLAKDQNCTQFTLLFAAYQTLLHRYTGATDICIGCPTSGRPDESFASTVGYFVNPIVIRCQLTSDLTFLDFLNQVKETVASGLKYSNVPLQYLAEHFNIKRDNSFPPLFQTIFTVKRAHRLDKVAGFIAGNVDATINLGDFCFRSYPLPSLGAQVDVSLSIVEVDDTYAIRIEYNPDLFKEETIRRLGVHYGSILDSIIANPNMKLGHLSIMPKEEYLFLGDWTTHIKDEAQGCLHSLFENQVELQPNIIALRAPECQLTYAELNFIANKIARMIIKNSLEKTHPIAIMMNNLSLQVGSMLGILKSGHPFIVLDTASPMLRINEILFKALPVAILLDSTTVKSHGASIEKINTFGCRIMVLDHEIEIDDVKKMQNPNLDISESSAAYVVFTSGSTGTPKGILQSHRSFVQFLKWQSQTFNMTQGARVANWSSLIYDASYCEIFGALGFGATLCVTESSIRYNPVELIHWLDKEQITIFQTVPSFFNMIIQSIESEPNRNVSFKNLTHIMLAGEALRSELITSWRRLFGSNTNIWNLYGPTEAVLATYYQIENIDFDQLLVPIGQAIDGRQILILDENGEICPIGIPGEIFIRSPYLTIGYFREPEQTYGSFQLNPLINDSNDRVFRTRDSGRRLANGLIEFLGRLDGQVKIRGMRVELGEIEARVSRHEDIAEVAVNVIIDNCNEPRLVAYIVTSTNIDAQIMRNFLKPVLPIFMIPDVFINVSHLPRTATNKINRKALPEPIWNRENESDIKLPLQGLEKEVADLWLDLLKVDDFDINTSFFDLGGHSLKATRFVNKIRLLFNVEVSLKDFFEDPTIAGVVAIIRRSQVSNVEHLPSLLSILDDIEKLSDDNVSSALNKLHLTNINGSIKPQINDVDL